ncbi:MAG: ScpA family protein [Candidatus Methanoperedens sp.]|nr:ScpA family protein [Candidatus Methanoperedens sp.]
MTEAKVIPGEDIREEPIEILVNLAKNGEIDPWNINIVELTDKFLKRVDELEKMDLRVSGRTLLYASILLRMKSNALVEVEEPPEEIDIESDNFEISDYPVPSMPLRRYSKRPVTLEELLTELKRAEAFEKKRLNRVENKKDEIRATLEDVLSVAHEEDIENRIGKMRYILNELLEKQKSIKFSEISSTLDRTGILMAYLAILFLATKKEIWIEQEEFFGEIFISRTAS